MTRRLVLVPVPSIVTGRCGRDGCERVAKWAVEDQQDRENVELACTIHLAAVCTELLGG